MSTLYLVSTPAALPSCLATARPTDVVLLQGAAARAAADVQGWSMPPGVSVFYLIDDLPADHDADASRDDANRAIEGVPQPATLAEFVALVLRCHPVVCWR
ncbi:MAG: hypothetical protein ACKOBM_12575 [Gammaproteobacteria bacterium]